MAATTLLASAAMLAAAPGQQPTVQLNNGVMMPVLALGTGGYDNATAEDAVTKALALGFAHVHSAFDYYNLPGVGKGLATAASRSDVFVTGMTAPCVHPAAPPQRNVTDPEACYNLTLAELHEVLDLLGVDHLDLALVHGPSEPFGYEGGCGKEVCAINRAQWRAYEAFAAEGKARAIGVSNYCQSCLQCLAEGPDGVATGATVPAVNQFQSHVGMGRDPGNLRQYCAEKGIVVQAYGPLAGGDVATDPLCAKIGKKYNRSAAQVGLRWVLSSFPNTTLVTKADSAEYLQEDLETFAWDFAGKHDMKELDEAKTPHGQQDGRPSWGCAK